MSRRPLVIAPEVTAMLPAELRRRYETDPGFESLACVVCNRQIPRGQPAALVIRHDPVLGLRQVVNAHPACHPSAVVTTDLAGLAAADELRVTAGAWPRAAGYGDPLLVVETESQVELIAESGDLSDLWISQALKLGLSLVARMAPDGPPFVYDGRVTAPGYRWAEAVAAAGAVRLYTGATLVRAELDDANLTTALAHLARAGRLAAAVIPATLTP